MHILPALHCKQANEYSDDWNSLDASLHSCGRVAREYTPPSQGEHPVQSLAAKREREEEEEQAN